jgi:N utilization substance protein B
MKAMPVTEPGRFEERRRARRRALQALYQWQMTAQPVAEIFTQFKNEQDFSLVDEAFFVELVEGVTTSVKDLEAVLNTLLDRSLEHLDVMERVILSLGAWELANQPGTPFSVVINEAIDLAHRFGAEGGHAYVNAVLDKAARHWRPQEMAAAGR